MDLGSGDGKGPYRLAQKHPDRLFVAVDLNADALRRTAWRAGRRPSRGGVANLACVAASPTELARELPDVADRVSVILPWGELFRAVVTPEHATLAAIAHLCQKDAFFEIVFSYDPARDAGAAVLPARYELSATELRAHLDGDYRRAGLNFAGVQLVDQRALLAYPTTWAKRLAHGRPRRVWRIWGVKA